MNLYEFIAHYGIIEFSIGTALGISFSKFIQSLTHELIIPMIGIFFKIKNLKNYSVVFKNQIFDVGIILSSLISYIILLLLIILFTYYIFGNIVQKIRDIKLKISKETLEHQRNISKHLEDLVRLQKQEKIHGTYIK